MAGAHPKPRPLQSSHSFCNLKVFFRNVAALFSSTIYTLQGFVFSFVSGCVVLVLDQNPYVYS